MKLSLTTLLALLTVAATGVSAYYALEKRVSYTEWVIRWHGLDKTDEATEQERRISEEAEWYGHRHWPDTQH